MAVLIHKKGSSKAFGGIFSFNYNRQGRYSEIIRKNFDPDGIPRFDFNDQQYSYNVLAGGLANLTYRSGSNKFSWKNSYNINSTDQTTLRQGVNIDGDREQKMRSQELGFNSNRLFNSQLIGEHYLRSIDVKIKWNANYALMKQDVPDLRRLFYTEDANGDFYANIPIGSGNPRFAGRFFSTLNEHLEGGTLDLSKSFKLFRKQQTIKIGGLFQRKDRTFDARGVAISRASGTDSLVYLPPAEIFNKNNYGADKFYLVDLTSNADSYKAYSNLGAGFVQFDNQFGEKFRLVWGARIEAFKQHLESVSLDPVQNDAVDILPSLNLTYLLNEKVNVRLSASQTVSRPEFREISPFTFYDYERNGVIYGNPALERSKITNADLRYEFYPDAGEVFTLGVFYKYFDHPIETTYETGQGAPSISFQNAESASSYGVELEFRKKAELPEQRSDESFHPVLERCLY